MSETNYMRQDNETNLVYKDLYSRSYKLVAAIHIVYNLVDGENSLKTRIKDLCIQLLGESSLLDSASDKKGIDPIIAMGHIVRELGALIRVTLMSGIISEMNGKILSEASDGLLSVIEKTASTLRHPSNLSQVISSELVGIPVSNNNGGSVQLEKTLPLVAAGSVNGYSVTNGSANGNGAHAKKNNGVRKNSRREAIFNVLMKNDGVGIKDIMPEVKGCSEKTVQRELLTLVESGQVLKEGDRRWSKYYLAK